MKFLILIVFIIIMCLLYNAINKEKIYLKGFMKFLCISLVIAFVLELFVFNFRHFESLFYGETIDAKYTLGDGIKCHNGVCNMTNTSESYIEIENINRDVSNVKLDISSNNDLIVQVDVYLRDEGNEVYYKAGDRTYTESIDVSKYIKLNPSGKLKSIKLDLWQIDESFKINKVILNAQVPINFNFVRYILVILISLFLCFIQPKSVFHNIKFDSKASIIVIAGMILLLTIMSFKMTTKNQYVKDLYQYQYNYLAEALIDGHFDLDIPVDKTLLSMKNPYDTNNRKNVKADYFWDFAFYKGKYYTYFGIVPCLLFYVPVHLILDKGISDYYVLFITSVLFFISTCIFLYQLCKKYFKNTSIPTFIIMALFMMFSSSFPLALGEPTYYNIPILMANAFAYLGLACYIASKNYSKKYKKYLLSLGSLFIALTAGCRPQFLVSAFFAIPLFWDDIFKKRELMSKKSIKESITFMLPFLIVAAFLMYYNYARFASPFDFGANYNLTTNDMTHRGFHLDRIPLGLFTYLFETPRITSIFPYVLKYDVNTTYIGTTISEKMRGGFMIVNFICLISLIPWKFKNLIKDKTLYKFVWMSLIFALIIIILDTEMAGILARYFMDFGWLFSLSTIIIILSLFDKYKNNDLRKVINILMIISIIYNLLLYVTQSSLYIDQDLFYEELYHFFIFWL